MSTTTTNLKFIKPELTDTADITAMNENWDKADLELSQASDRLNAVDQRLDGVDTEFAEVWEELNSGFGEVDQELSEADTRLNTVDQELSEADTRLNTVEQRLDGVDTEFTEVWGELNKGFGEVDQEFDDVNTRLDELSNSQFDGILPPEKGGTGKADLNEVKVGSAEWATWATHMGRSDCSNTDFNTLKTPGYYFGYTGMTNAAVTSEICVVEIIPYSDDWLLQRQTRLRDGKTFYRYFSNGTTWSNWESVYTTGHRSYTYGTSDLTAGSSPLGTGEVYLVYE